MSSVIIRRPPVEDSHLSCVAHPVVRQIFANRGVKSPQELDKTASSLLHFKKLKGIEDAVSILATAITSGKKIIVIGDFDADGATSTTLSMLSLSQLGSREHSYLVPNRFDFGYGLSPQIVEIAHQQNAQVIMTVDNGIACLEGVAKAKQLGIQVVITDHHLAGKSLPDADAIVNPNQPGCEFDSKHLAGVGVAFYVMLALRSHLKAQNWFTEHGLAEPNLASLLDIVALGTVADVVPLDRNNRVLVHQGLQRIRSGKCRPGISALIEVAGRSAKRINASDLGFVVGPRLNAAGRLDDMALGIECLLAEDLNQARRMAVELDALNRERREIQQSMQDEALSSLSDLDLQDHAIPFGIVLYKADYHQGVIGILAGKIKEKFNRPTIAFAHQDDSNLKGSARSIPGLHIRDLLEEISTRYPGIIDKFGGHAMAAGLNIAVAQLPAFTQAFEQVASEILGSMDLTGQVVSDGPLKAHDLSIDFANYIKEAGPWGQHFPEPLFDGEFSLLEHKLLSGKHLKMIVKDQAGNLLDAIAFNVEEGVWPDHNISKVRLAYRLDINEFRGKTSLQLMIEEIEKM